MNCWHRYTNVIWITVLLTIWWIASWYINNDMVLPSPLATGQALYHNLHQWAFWQSVFGSLGNLAMAWLLTMVLLVLFIFFANFSTSVRSLQQTLIGIFSPMPSFALMPILLLTMGITQATMTAALVFSMLWINLSAMIHVTDSIKQQWQPHCCNLNLSSMASYRSVYLPAMSVDLLSSAKNAWALGWRTLLAVEVTFGNFGSGQGLGVSMMMDRAMFKSVDLWATLVVIVIIGSSILWLFDRLIAFTREKLT